MKCGDGLGGGRAMASNATFAGRFHSPPLVPALRSQQTHVDAGAALTFSSLLGQFDPFALDVLCDSPRRTIAPAAPLTLLPCTYRGLLSVAFTAREQ